MYEPKGVHSVHTHVLRHGVLMVSMPEEVLVSRCPGVCKTVWYAKHVSMRRATARNKRPPIMVETRVVCWAILLLASLAHGLTLPMAPLVQIQ